MVYYTESPQDNGVLDREPPNLISDPGNMSMWKREIKAAGEGKIAS